MRSACESVKRRPWYRSTELDSKTRRLNVVLSSSDIIPAGNCFCMDHEFPRHAGSQLRSSRRSHPPCRNFCDGGSPRRYRDFVIRPIQTPTPASHSTTAHLAIAQEMLCFSHGCTNLTHRAPDRIITGQWRNLLGLRSSPSLKTVSQPDTLTTPTGSKNSAASKASISENPPQNRAFRTRPSGN
jgi:hypothetical protein